MVFETVHTMTDWYDGPRRGVAMVSGRPHLYESCWSDIDSIEDDVYLLSPISDTLLSAAIEDWQIWERWSRAYKSGDATLESHPALPEERTRHTDLQRILKTQLVIDENSKLAATATFRYKAQGEPRMEAEWTIVEYDSSKDKRDKYRWEVEEEDPDNPMDRDDEPAAS